MSPSVRRLGRSLASLLALACAGGSARAVTGDLLPTRPGYAVVTQGPAVATDPAVQLIDIRCPEQNAPPLPLGGPPPNNWSAVRDANQANPAETWTTARFGTPIFGVALDQRDHPNIFVTSSSVYVPQPGMPANGDVFEICGQTGNVCRIASLPVVLDTDEDKPSLGNVAYDAAHDQLFVTSFDDGKIYRIPLGGLGDCALPDSTCPFPLLSYDSYDPFQPDEPSLRWAPPCERLWGIGIHCGRLYFGRWNVDSGHHSDPPAACPANDIWSIDLMPSGGFPPAGSEVLEITIPTTPGVHPNPPSDIEFSETGAMLVAERTHWRADDTSAGPADAHEARVLEFVPIGPHAWGWNQQVLVGAICDPNDPAEASNSTGGADYARCAPPSHGCPTPLPYILANGDALECDSDCGCHAPANIYGLQITPVTGGNRDNSYLIDLDDDLVDFQLDKGGTGDVDYFRYWSDCLGDCGVACCDRHAGPPVFADCPPDAEYPCDADVPDPPVVHASSYCTGLFEAVYQGQVPAAPTGCSVLCKWLATDSCGRQATCVQLVTIHDVTAPVIECPPDLTVDCDADLPARDFAGGHATDDCGAVTVAWRGDVPAGSCPTVIARTYVATDACGNSITCTQAITVHDTGGPQLAQLPIQICLWPPNHWYVCFHVSDFAPAIVDNCDPHPTWRFAGCASDQCDDAPCLEHPGENGDGRTVDDCVVDGPMNDGNAQPGEWFCVRAERAGTDPDGRHYAITIVMSDACGNETVAQLGTVYVPHDQMPHEKACIKTTKAGCHDDADIPNCPD